MWERYSACCWTECCELIVCVSLQEEDLVYKDKKVEEMIERRWKKIKRKRKENDKKEKDKKEKIKKKE